MPADRFDFPNAQGHRLAGLLDEPSGEVRAYALFAHCFTCGKDIRAARRVAAALTGLGIAVLRFDFTGLGSSEGEFANTTFSSNVTDLIAAADELRKQRKAPAILIGHSLGGSAVLAAAAAVPEARAVVTIAAPFDPAHVVGLFKGGLEPGGAADTIEASIGGRSFRVRRAFLDEVAEQSLAERIGGLHKALLIFHSPTDEIVGIDHASRIFLAAKHPKSFVSLAGADHVMSQERDAAYVASVIAAWAERYLEVVPRRAIERGTVLVRETRVSPLQQEVLVGTHRLIADEPASAGGRDSGPNPYDLLLAALGACTAMTLRLYAGRKGLPLDRVTVRLQHAKIHATDCEGCETKNAKIDHIDAAIMLEGRLDEAQRARLMEIADKCPVHRTLTSQVDLRTIELRDPPELTDPL